LFGRRKCFQARRGGKSKVHKIFFPFATGVNDTGSAANISALMKRPTGILRGLGETDSSKKPEVENLVALSF
jgi:hypothetical protein